MRRLQEVFGGNAVSDEYHIGRHVANLFVTQTYEGQSDIHGKLGQDIPLSHVVLIHVQLLFLDVQSLVFKLSVKKTYLARSQAPNPVERLTDAFMLCKIAHKTNSVQSTKLVYGRSVCLKVTFEIERVMMRAVPWTLIGSQCAECMSECLFVWKKKESVGALGRKPSA
jgi:hypothetical protein